MKHRSHEAAVAPLSSSAAWQNLQRNAPSRKATAQEIGLFAAVLLVLAYMAFGLDVYAHQRALSLTQETHDFDISLIIGSALACMLVILGVRWFVEQQREMTRRIAAEAQAWKLAHTDALTGLSNRRQFEDMLSTALAEVSEQTPVALLMLDLNGFKQINDVHGHATGDKVLRLVAARLKRAVRVSDHVARLGGDEFVVLAPALENRAEAGAIASRIIEALREPITVAGQRFDVGTGIGIAFLPDDADDAEEAIRRADVALYSAKCGRKSAFRYFEAEMDKSLRQQLSVQCELRTAIESSLVETRFQPFFDAATGEVDGYVALPFWAPLDCAEFAPEALLSLAEEIGMLDELTDLVWEDALRAAADWRHASRLAIRIRSSQIGDSQFGDRLLSMLERSGVDPRRLDIELDETAMNEKTESLKAFLVPLQARGIRITLAGFGGETNRLQWLKALKIGSLRINRTLDARTDCHEHEISIRALSEFGRTMGFAVSIDADPAAASQYRG